MDVTTRDFSLNFRGFDHEDPETVRRFCAFCEANFDLLPEQAERLASQDETIVLTHSNSSEELEALAKVLREIGARVEVSAESTPGLFDTSSLPDTQELHRLFRPDGDAATSTSSRGSRIAPIGSSLYLVNPSLAIPEHAEILRRRKRAPHDNSVAPGKFRATSIATAATLILFGAALGGAVGTFAFKPQESAPTWNSNAQSAQLAIPSSTLIKHDVSKPLSGAIQTSGYRVEVKALISGTAASIRSFIGDAIVPVESNSLIPRRFEGEPAFLENVADGVWEGTLTFYTFQNRDGNEERAQRQAKVKLSLSRDPLSANAHFTIVPLPTSNGESGKNSDALPLSNLTVTLAQ